MLRHKKFISSLSAQGKEAMEAVPTQFAIWKSPQKYEFFRCYDGQGPCHRFLWNIKDPEASPPSANWKVWFLVKHPKHTLMVLRLHTSKNIVFNIKYMYFDVTKSLPLKLNWFLSPVIRNIYIYVIILTLALKSLIRVYSCLYVGIHVFIYIVSPWNRSKSSWNWM